MLNLFLEIVGNFANLTGAIGGVVSACGVLTMISSQRRALEKVEITLRLEGEEGVKRVLPLEMRRRDVSRAEILGRMGMATRAPGQKFALKALATPAFMRAINAVVEGKTSTLVIPCSSREEMDQFAE